MKRSLLLFFLPFIVFTYFSFIVSQQACDYVMSNKPEKKLPFNHRNHLSKTLDYGISGCEDCHGFTDNGRFKGLPSVGDCTGCHDREGSVGGNDFGPKRKPFFDNYKDSDRPWGAYAKQPDLVYFSHKVVMSATDKNGNKRARCSSCHGDKADSINGKKLKGKMLMGQCMDCHTALKISNKCAVCHD